MGACYSKHIGSREHKQGPIKQSGSKIFKKKYGETCCPEASPLKTKDTTQDNVDVDLPTEKLIVKLTDNVLSTRSSTPDLIPDDTIISKEGGVVPSDSGIESIGVTPEDIQEHTLSSSEQDELTKKLQRLSRGSCSRCGNFKLDDSAFTALLADTYCSCGPRQAGKVNVNPNCKTHGQKRLVSNDISTNKPSTFRKISDIQQTKYVRISEQPATSVCSESNDVDMILYSPKDVDDLLLAPLAHFDSLDTISSQSQKRRSLLSEILNITDSICRCDFYSNELNCSFNKNQHIEEVSESHLEAINCASQSSPSPATKTLQAHEGVRSEELHCELISPSEKSTSLPKNVSFAAHQYSAVEVSVKPRISREYQIPFESCTSQTSSGVFTHNSTSDPYLSKKMLKDTVNTGNCKRSLSLNSRGVLLSDSSSEMLNICSDEDLVSLDLDSITSFSQASLRCLGSSEDVCLQSGNCQRAMLEGTDYLIIEKHVYQQMQVDVSNLKKQLQSLSTLLQEVVEDQ